METLGVFVICIFSIVLPISTTFWVISAIFLDEDEASAASPGRWLISMSLPVFIACYGIKKKSLDFSGAIAGLFIGFLVTYSSYFFCVCLMVFFLTSSRATKFRSKFKKQLEDDFKEVGGQRNWMQVLCNGGMAAELALLYMIDCSCGERIIDFKSDYRASWLAIGVMSSLACCNGDTWASELGSVFKYSTPYLITTGKKVPKGTNGGISAAGLFFSAAGGFVIGLSYYISLLIAFSFNRLEEIGPQWPIVLVGTFAGLFGSIVDSFLGATLQYSGIDTAGRIASRPGPGVRHIAGLSVLDNHSVNLLSSVITGVVVPKLSVLIWEMF
ncbi:hypothetical protein CHUAL_013193 [Chamberlinius hualienensis]